MKKTSFILIIILCVVVAVNGADAVKYALHDCTADGCAVCLMYQAASDALGPLRSAAPAELTYIPFIAAAVCLYLLVLRSVSPLARKVRLNN